MNSANEHINSSKTFQKCSSPLCGSQTQNLHNYQGHRKVLKNSYSLIPMFSNTFLFLTQPCDRHGHQEKNWQIRSSLSQPWTFIFYVLLPFLLSPPKQQKTPTFLFQCEDLRTAGNDTWYFTTSSIVNWIRPVCIIAINCHWLPPAHPSRRQLIGWRSNQMG